MIKLQMSRKEWNTSVIICVLVIAGMTGIYISEQAPILIIILLLVPPMYVMFGFLVSSGRELILDSNGCTVKILWYKKHYQWDELLVKRVDCIKNRRNKYLSYNIKNAVFAPYEIYKPGRWQAEDFSTFFHPLSVMYIYLISTEEYEKLDERVMAVQNFVMDENVFFGKMQEWNVELTITEQNEKKKTDKRGGYISEKVKNIVVIVSVILMLVGVILALITHEMKIYMPFVVIATILTGIEKITRKKR